MIFAKTLLRRDEESSQYFPMKFATPRVNRNIREGGEKKTLDHPDPARVRAKFHGRRDYKNIIIYLSCSAKLGIKTLNLKLRIKTSFKNLQLKLQIKTDRH